MPASARSSRGRRSPTRPHAATRPSSRATSSATVTDSSITTPGGWSTRRSTTSRRGDAALLYPVPEQDLVAEHLGEAVAVDGRPGVVGREVVADLGAGAIGEGGLVGEQVLGAQRGAAVLVAA